MTKATLSLRALNRATLARQLLLARAALPVVEAVERQVALQAQLARPPFVGLWTRVAGFEREALARALHGREVVRATLLRGTLHLMSARDYLALRPALQPALDRGMQAILRERAGGVDFDALLAAARTFFAQPHTFDAFREFVLAGDPKADERALAYAVRCKLPLVQAPTAATWGFPGAAEFTVADAWLGRPLAGDADPRALVLRYLAAFGPATPGDAQTWSGLTGLREVFAALRPALVSLRDERGRELFDLPDAPRPDPDTPAPVRFLADYDSLVLGHDDRTRLIADEHRPAIVKRANLQVLATFLVDGRVAGTWKLARTGKKATLKIEPFAPLLKKIREEMAEEGERLVRFAEPDATTFAVELPGGAGARTKAARA